MFISLLQGERPLISDGGSSLHKGTFFGIDLLASLLRSLWFCWWFATISLVFPLAYCCPAGSIVGLRPDECYLSRPAASWIDAEEDCVVAGGHLASVHDAFTNSFLRKLPKYNASNNTGLWIGGSVGGTNKDRWTWTDGSAFDFVNWAKGLTSTLVWAKVAAGRLGTRSFLRPWT